MIPHALHLLSFTSWTVPTLNYLMDRPTLLYSLGCAYSDTFLYTSTSEIPLFLLHSVKVLLQPAHYLVIPERLYADLLNPLFRGPVKR